MEVKEWWQSRTIWANFAVIVAAVLASFGLDIEVGTLELLIVTVVNIGLRFATKSPVQV